MRGRTLLRAAQNLDVSRYVTLRGDCLDLGAKSAASSYYEHATREDDAILTCSDFYSSAPDLSQINLAEPLPVSDDSYDTVLLFNVLEHIFDTRLLLAETRRVLRPGGTLYGVVPFYQRYHPDPSDYWRFTHVALQRLLAEAGFSAAKIRPHGCGAFTVSAHQWSSALKFRPLVFLSWWASFGLDRMLGRFRDTNNAYYLGLFFEARK